MYGHLVHDNFIYVPSLFGFITSVVQGFVYMWAVGILNPSALPDTENTILILKQKIKLISANLLKNSERLLSTLIQSIKSLRKRIRPSFLIKQACAEVTGEPKIKELEESS